MASLPRLDQPNVPPHIVQRGNNRQALFFHDDDSSAYREYLREALVKNDCKLYPFVLMTNTPTCWRQARRRSGLTQSVGRYVRYGNTTFQRSGTLFEGRFKSDLMDSENYQLKCMRYIELNPVRAGMVTHPGDYQ